MSEAPSLGDLTSACDLRDSVVIYALIPDESKGAVPPEQVNRLHGMPIGVDDERWPRDADDEPRWEHIFTLDLATMPDLARAAPGYRAAAFFVCDPWGQTSYLGPELKMKWVWLTEQDVARGVVATEDASSWDAHPFRGSSFHVEEHRVPRKIFEELEGDEALEPSLEAVRDAVAALPGRAGGGAIPIQFPPYLPDDPFFVQIDETFGNLNLGDCGSAYISRVDALWDCH